MTSSSANCAPDSARALLLDRLVEFSLDGEWTTEGRPIEPGRYVVLDKEGQFWIGRVYDDIVYDRVTFDTAIAWWSVPLPIELLPPYTLGPIKVDAIQPVGDVPASS